MVVEVKNKRSDYRWINRAGLGVVVLLLISSYAQASAQKTAMVFDYPSGASWVKPAVLGDEDQEEKTEENHEREQRQEEQKREEESKREEEKQQAEERKETEIETQDGQKIKTKVEDDGTTKVEIEQDDLKIKYEVKNGEVNNIEEDEDEVEVEDELEAENELDDDELEISTEEERHTVRLNGVGASTNFPLSIDVATNELIVATKDGPKIVAVLPDRAVANLLATGIVDRVDSATDLELQVQDGVPVYQIAGTKRYRLFAFIPVTQPVVSVVSAETGEVVTTQQSVFANMVDFLSP